MQHNHCNEADYNQSSIIICGIAGNPEDLALYYSNQFSCSSNCYILSNFGINVKLEYVYFYLLENINIIKQFFTGNILPILNKNLLSNYNIIVPSITIQENIIFKKNIIYNKMEENENIIAKINRENRDLL